MTIMVHGKSLSQQQNDNARAFIKSVIDEDFEGKQTDAARKWQLSQSSISGFLSGIRGAGMKLLRAVSEYRGTTIDAILGGAEVAGAPSAKERRESRQARYPNQESAIDVWTSQRQREGDEQSVLESVVAEVRSMQLDSEGDLSPAEWMDRLDEAARKARRRRLGHASKDRTTAAEWLASAPPELEPYEMMKVLMERLKKEKEG